MYKEALENFEELMKVASKEEIEAIATEILMVNQYKNDKAAIKGMIKSRLGEGATDEQVDKAYKKWILTGIFPAKPKTEKTASELLDEMVKEASIKK